VTAVSQRLDTSDLDRFLGVTVSRARTAEPVSATDIRRWVQAMHHPNPLHYDDEYAAASRFGGLVAPQSFTIVCDDGHGVRPAMVGKIADSHMLFAGDEWEFFGARIRPGDTITVEHTPFDYRVTETAFAGPTVIARGDTTYSNDRGERIAVQRGSAFRYRPVGLRDSAKLAGREEAPVFTDDQVAQHVKEKEAYARAIRELGHEPRRWRDVEPGAELPTKVMGPHTVVSFATEWRAYYMNNWNTLRREQLVEYETGMSHGSARLGDPHLDPEFADGGNDSPHLFSDLARKIGMPRPYGFGASIGAWVLDFLADWAGEWGMVKRCSTQYRGPALAGDLTYVRGTVKSKTNSDEDGMGVVEVDFVMTSHEDHIVAKGTSQILLPQ
jgi:acyl dehydratase